MKKKLLNGLLLVLFAAPIYSQTIVSTTPENKKVILEEFTGINCVYCPDGHAIANSIKNNNPDNVFLINVHAGGYATPGAGQPDFRTNFGTGINNQAGVAGYPAGTVNRHVFSGMSQNGAGGTAMGRNYWSNAASQILTQSSYVNVGVEASINVQTRVLTVNVEAYYTGDSPVSTNKLNVALMQNNTKGPQVGGNMGNQYNHMHRLVDMLTGQWGVDISNTTSGSLISETFTYTIPPHYKNIEAELAELEIVAFITETTQEIISGNGTSPTYTNFAHNHDVAIKSVKEIGSQCTEQLSSTITLENRGSNTVTSVDIDYTINSGTVNTFTWNGNLTSLKSVEIDLPEVSYTMQSNNSVFYELGNDDNIYNNGGWRHFNKATHSMSALNLTIQTDAYGGECTWNIKNAAGATVASGGPYANNQTYNIPVNLGEGCFQFNLIDSYGDGGKPVNLVDLQGITVYTTTGNYGTGESVNFSTNGMLNTTDNKLQGVTLYPIPSTGIINLAANTQSINIRVYDITGKMVFTAEDMMAGDDMDLSALSKGMYLVKLSDGVNEQTEKIILK